ncbi:MBL fold metallo-hydrolase [Kaarinaea lacus]
MERLILRIFIAIVVGIVFLNITAQAEQLYPMQAKPVAPGVYAVITPTRELPNPENRGWNSNSAFVVTQSGVLLFDTGSSTIIGQSLKSTIAAVTDQPVRWIVNSHGHGDHWLGNAAFKSTVEKVFATTQVNNTIRNDGQNWIETFNRMTEGATGKSEILPPNDLVNQRTELTLGGKKVVLFPSGNSHSPGDLILWLPEAKVLISGDVVYSDRMPSTFASNLSQWIILLDDLQKLQPEIVIPGHGDVTDSAGLVRLQQLLQAFWREVEKEYQLGKTDYEMTPAVTQALSSFRADFPGLEDKIRRDISHVYLQVEAASFE